MGKNIEGEQEQKLFGITGCKKAVNADGGDDTEEKSGKGFADFIFHPRRQNIPGIILELKSGDTPEAAIAQIKNKEYCEKLKKEHVEEILAVGISYNIDKKEHQCVIEELE